MRIHTNTLSASDVHLATRDLPGVFATVTEHGSRSRDHALEVRLVGTSPYRTMDGQDHAATWDEWGVVMASIFEVDPYALIGNNSKHFEDADLFDLRTGGRFADLALPYDTHPRHNWQFIAPFRFACSKCSATLNTERF